MDTSFTVCLSVCVCLFVRLILELSGAPVLILLDPSWPNLVCEIRPTGSVYCIALQRRNPQIWPFFQLKHSMVAPSSGVVTESNAGAQLETVVYPSISKSFVSKCLVVEVVSTNSTIQL